MPSHFENAGVLIGGLSIMGHRQEPRIQLNSQASLCGMDPHQGRSFLEPVMIRNISHRGLLVQVRRWVVKPGDIVVLRRGQNKGRFQVIWVGETADGQRKQLGLRRLRELIESGPEVADRRTTAPDESLGWDSETETYSEQMEWSYTPKYPENLGTPPEISSCTSRLISVSLKAQ